LTNRLLALTAYNLKVIPRSRREFLTTPLAVAVVSVAIISYRLSPTSAMAASAYLSSAALTAGVAGFTLLFAGGRP